MKSLYLCGMFSVLALSVSQSWAGKQFYCNIPLTPEIISAINASPTTHLTTELFDGNNAMIRIYSTNPSNAYTNIAAGITTSYVQNGIVQEIYGNIDATHMYAAYLSVGIRGGMTAWNFVFFNPREDADITKRYFVMGTKCSMLDYNDTQIPGLIEGIPNGIIQSHNPARVIKDNFANLYQLYNNPEITYDMERDVSCVRPTEYVIVAGAILLTACLTLNHLTNGK